MDSRLMTAVTAAVLAPALSAASQGDAQYLQGGDPYGMHFFTPSHGVVTYDGGLIRITTDGGITWTQATTPQSVRAQLKGIQFLDANEDIGFAVGSNGTFLKTIDGGQTWTQGATVLQPPLDSDPPGTQPTIPAVLHELWFFNEQEGYVVGDNRTIAFTDDGGASWTQLDLNSIPVSVDPSDPIDAYDLHFWSEDEGIIALDEGWLIRLDPQLPGVWAPILIPSSGLASCNPGLTNLEFWAMDFDGDVGFLSGGIGTNDGFVLRSVNRGKTWTNELCFSAPDYAPTGCSATKPTLYGVANFGQDASGHDMALAVGYGSTKWERQRPGASDSCGAGPEVYWGRTAPSTTSFNPPLNWVESLGQGLGYVTGTFGVVERIRRVSDPTTGLFATQSTSLGSTETLRVTASTFPTANIGFQGGQFGRILRTTDGGQTMEVVRTSPSASAGSEYIRGLDGSSDGQLVIAAGTTGILYSTSGGDAGTWLQSNVASSINGVDLDDTGVRAFAVGDQGRVFRSDDGGATWTQVTSPGLGALVAARFLTPDLGVVVGAQGRVHYTVDGGASWISTQCVNAAGQPETKRLESVTFSGTLVVACGQDGGLYAANVGVSLVPVAVDTGLAAQNGTTLNDVAFDAVSGALYVVGDGGVVLKFSGGAWSNPRPMTGFQLVGANPTPAGLYVSSRRSGLVRF